MTILTSSTVSEVHSVEGFGNDPWWLVLLKVLGIFALLVVLTLFNIWFERRVVARMQHRVGPNKNGPFGLLQSLADGIKLSLKEEIIPAKVDRLVYWVAPVIAAIPAFLVFSIIPIGPEVSIFGVETPLQLTDVPVAVLLVLGFASMGVYGIVLAGWSSSSTYSLLGGLRSSAQVISYEIAMGLSFVAVFMYAGTMSTSQIVAAQQDIWFGVLLIPSFAIYLIAMVGETNRAPFDLPEAEGELVGGFHTEYNSFKFAMFFLAEYINMVNVSALAATLFLGGWRAPWPISAIGDGYFNTGWWPVLWFIGKVMIFIFIFVWLRGTLPRLRYDQFMAFGWKWLIPISLVWIAIVAGLRLARNEFDFSRQPLLIAAGALAVIAMAFLLFGGRRQESAARRPGVRAAPPPASPYTAYPTPPMPGATIPQPVGAPAREDAGDTSSADRSAEEAPRA